jgi:hypothetical protein
MTPDKDNIVRVLEIDGGGLRGVITAIVAAKLETELQKVLDKKDARIYEVFDLITGTSTGAIIGGALACGVPARKIEELYITQGARLFKTRLPFNPGGIFGPIYSRRYIKNELKNTKNDFRKKLDVLSLNDVKTKLILTTFNLCSNKTHFIKSWNRDQNHYPVVEAISWSALSAAYYFGKINVKDYPWNYYDPDLTKHPQKGACFQDGGQGINNNTIFQITSEILALGPALKLKNHQLEKYVKKNGCFDNPFKVVIVSLGTGMVKEIIEFNKAKHTCHYKQILLYFCQARSESTRGQVLAANHICGLNNNFYFYRIDCRIKKKESRLDGKKFIQQYRKYGESLNTAVENVVERLIQEGLL